MAEITERTWEKKKAKLATQFDIQCYRTAVAMLALQQRELVALQKIQAGKVDQLEMIRITKAIKDIQHVGRLAIGEITESKQYEFDLRVTYGTPPA